MDKRVNQLEKGYDLLKGKLSRLQAENADLLESLKKLERSTYMRKDEEHSESKEGEANAAFIVRAVNLFDRLLAEHKSDRHHAEICSICREAQA